MKWAEGRDRTIYDDENKLQLRTNAASREGETNSDKKAKRCIMATE